MRDSLRQQIRRACAKAWADLPPQAVAPGDRVRGNVVRVAIEQALRLLPTQAGVPIEPPGAEWVAAAVSSLGGGKKELLTHDDFITLVEQHCELVELAGTNIEAGTSLRGVPANAAEDPQMQLTDQVQKLCQQAFFWVDADRVETLNASQCKTALTLVFSWLKMPNPPDAWHEAVFDSFAGDEDGVIDFEDLCDIAVQHVELNWNVSVSGMSPSANIHAAARSPEHVSAPSTVPAPTRVVQHGYGGSFGGADHTVRHNVGNATHGGHAAAYGGYGGGASGRHFGDDSRTPMPHEMPAMSHSTPTTEVVSPTRASPRPAEPPSTRPAAGSGTVAETCACGAIFSANAVFCHLCGAKRYPTPGPSSAPVGAAAGAPEEPRKNSPSMDKVPPDNRHAPQSPAPQATQRSSGMPMPPPASSEWVSSTAQRGVAPSSPPQIAPVQASPHPPQPAAQSSAQPLAQTTSTSPQSPGQRPAAPMMAKPASGTPAAPMSRGSDAWVAPDAGNDPRPAASAAVQVNQLPQHSLQQPQSPAPQATQRSSGMPMPSPHQQPLQQPHRQQEASQAPQHWQQQQQQQTSNFHQPPPPQATQRSSAMPTPPLGGQPSSVASMGPGSIADLGDPCGHADYFHGGAASVAVAAGAAATAAASAPAWEQQSDLYAQRRSTVFGQAPNMATGPQHKQSLPAKTPEASHSAGSAQADEAAFRRQQRKRTTFAQNVADVQEFNTLQDATTPVNRHSQRLPSTASSEPRSEWWDCNAPTPSPSLPGSRASVMSDRKQSFGIARRKSTRKSVPIASEVMTPAYTGELRVFDDYHFEDSKGSGAFGTVMQVTHKGTGLERACKSIKLKGRRQFELVQTEMELMRKLDHPHVLRLFECYYDGDKSIYLIIELCKGGSLQQRIEKYRQAGSVIQEPQAAWAIRDLFSGLDYCHRKGIIHRDIKPDNLLFTDAAVDSRLKVIDFGLSDFFARIDPAPANTMDSTRSTKSEEARRASQAAPKVGTPHFMAPEIYLEGIYEAKVDSFASGVVLAEMITGVHPYFQLGRDNLDTIRQRIVGNRVEYDAKCWQHVSPSAVQLVRNLLEPDRNRRLSAASALQHPWVTHTRDKNGPRCEDTLRTHVFIGLQDFGGYHVLKQAALRVLARQLDDQQLTKCHRQFELLDADCNGTLSAQELLDGAKRCGMSYKPQEVKDILEVFDRMNLGFSNGPEVNYSDFLASMLATQIVPTKQQMEYVFRRFCDNNFQVTPQSLRRALTAMTTSSSVGVPLSNPGEYVTDEDMAQVFQELGNGTRCVTFQAFCSMWRTQR